MTLDEIALKYNADKSSLFHNYTEKYDHYFSPLRQGLINILEIGIQNGYSLKTWKEYFPNAEIFGIDIVDCKQMDESRIKTLKGSQNDLVFLQKINDMYGPFDIIIDDGSHYNSDMKISFDFLFPLLKHGGIYVVEDLHCTYWPEFSDGNTAFMDRLKELMDSVNGNGKGGLAEIENSAQDHVYQERKYGEMDWWEKNVEYVHLHRSIVFIGKYEHGTNDIPKVRYSFLGKARLWRLAGKIIRRMLSGAKILLNRMVAIRNIFYSLPSREVLATYRKKIKVYDCFIFFNELELLDIRLHLLDKYVDHFVLIEATRTFMGTPKPLYYATNKDRFKEFNNKIIHIVADDLPDSLEELKNRYASASALDKKIINDCLTTNNIPKNEMQWLREFYQKEQIKKGLVNCSDNDICYISDSDEIWNPEAVIDYRRDVVWKMQQKMYAYYLNNRSSEKWYGTFATKYENIKNASINHLDTPSQTRYVYVKNGGWHFTNQGGADKIREKIESYGHQEFNNNAIKSNIEERMQKNVDFVGRKFKFWVDEDGLPAYIKENRAKFSALLK